MCIDLELAAGPANGAQTPVPTPAGPRPRQGDPSTTARSSPAAGSVQIREMGSPNHEALAPPFPQDEVKVQWDGQTMILQFLSPTSGEVIFQVPSQQILNLMHQIEQQLAAMAAKAPGAPELTGTKGGMRS